MRDRLIELISQVQYMGGLEKKLADHLLANGVIVPPCKVGDKVYVITTNWFGDFGKTVFLPREQAERALAERSAK